MSAMAGHTRKKMCALFIILQLVANIGYIMVVLYSSDSTLKESVSLLRSSKDQIHTSDSNASSKKKNHNRGIVICIFNKVFPLGISLIRELRCLGVVDPIELHYCEEKEMPAEFREIAQREPNVTLVDTCAKAKTSLPSRHGIVASFQGYWIKPLALIFSSFKEVMLVDVDSMFLHSPISLFDHPQYVRTGTIFFQDRVIPGSGYFNQIINKDTKETLLHDMVSTFNRSVFMQFKAVGPNSNETNGVPSDQLRNSLAWKGASEHYMDSSLVLFNKDKQERAIRILFELITEIRFIIPFSWGDKEAFFLSTELASSDYFMSPWGVSVISSNLDMLIHPDTLCGCIAQYYPDKRLESKLLYVNGRQLIQYDNVESAAVPARLRFVPIPTHVTPRHPSRQIELHEDGMECLTGLGSVPLPHNFFHTLARRRALYNSFLLGVWAETETAYC